MVCNTGSAAVYNRGLCRLWIVLLIIYAMKCKNLEGFLQGQEDTNLTVPENAVCLMLLISVILILPTHVSNSVFLLHLVSLPTFLLPPSPLKPPPSHCLTPEVRVLCSECDRWCQSAGSRHRMLGYFHTASALKQAFLYACPLLTWLDRSSSHGYSPLGFHQWVEFLWYSLGLAFLLSSSLCWHEPGFESSKISYFRTPQIYL